MEKLQWSEDRVRIKDVTSYEHNPRSIDKKRYNLLVKSIIENGYNNRLLVDIDNTIIGGHQRIEALQDAGFNRNDYITVLKPNRELTEQEFKRINIQDNVSFGEWNIDTLTSAFETPDIIEWGIDSSVFNDLLLEEHKEKSESKPQPKSCPHCGLDI